MNNEIAAWWKWKEWKHLHKEEHSTKTRGRDMFEHSVLFGQWLKITKGKREPESKRSKMSRWRMEKTGERGWRELLLDRKLAEWAGLESWSYPVFHDPPVLMGSGLVLFCWSSIWPCHQFFIITETTHKVWVWLFGSQEWSVLKVTWQ